MPYAAPTRCTTTGCTQYAVTRGKCHDHRPVWETPSANSRALTGAQRAKFKRQVLRREPNCRQCGQPATEADHIIPIAEGGATTDISNGQALCEPCHEAKTAADKQRGIERRKQHRRART